MTEIIKSKEARGSRATIPEVDGIGLSESLERQGEISALKRILEIKDKYRQEAIALALKENINSDDIEVLPVEISERMSREIAKVEDEYTVEGVCFAYCQFGEIVKDYKSGKRVEIEGFGPYLRDYISQMFETDYSRVQLSPEDEVGLRIMLAIIDEMPDVHVVSLFDEYNLGVAKAGPSGIPKEVGKNPKKLEPSQYEYDSEAPTRPGQLKAGSEKGQFVYQNEGTEFREINGEMKEIPRKIKYRVDTAIDYESKGRLTNECQTLRDEFRRWVEGVLKNRGVVREDAVEGPQSDYVLVSETDKIEDAKRLVIMLAKQGQIKGDLTSETGEIWFQGSIKDCEDPRYLQIKLRDEMGHWECAALDASGYYDNPEENRNERNRNTNITSLVILPDDPEGSNFRVQRAQVWELLHSLRDENGQPMFDSTQVHDIFVKMGADAAKVSDVIVDKLRQVGS